jgi:thymidylate synthase
MLQEIAARELGYELGFYRHSVSSLHLYDDNHEVASRTSAQRYLNEGIYESIAMPPMPLGTPWASIREFIAAESAIRNGHHDFPQNDKLDSYWKDLIELLRIHAIASAKPPPDNIAQTMADLLVKNVSSHVYRAYILDRIQRKLRKDQNMSDLFVRTREDAQP